MFGPAQCNLCQNSTCGQYNECLGFRGPWPLSLPCCCGCVCHGNHLPCSSSQVQRTPSEHFEDLEYIRFAFYGDCSLEASPVLSGVTAQRAPHGQAASTLHAVITSPSAMRAAVSYHPGHTRARRKHESTSLGELTCNKHQSFLLFIRR